MVGPFVAAIITSIIDYSVDSKIKPSVFIIKFSNRHVFKSIAF